MNRRSEPRLKVYSRAVVILIDNPAREYVCSLTDISSAGFKLLSSGNLPAGATAAVEVEDHLILAEIRHSEERGDKFAIGIQRLHTLAKRGLADDSSQFEKIQALINDFQRQGALERELQELFEEEQAAREPQSVASVAIRLPTIPASPPPASRPPASVPALPKLGVPSPARFAAVHPVLMHQALTPEPPATQPQEPEPPEPEFQELEPQEHAMTPEAAVPPALVEPPTLVEPPEEPDADLFEWAEKHRVQTTNRLLSQQKKLIRSRQMMIVIVAGVAIIALEALLLIVLVPRGHLHQSQLAPMFDSTPPAARLER